MASHAITIGNFSAFGRYGDSCGIYPQGFMIEVVKSGLYLVADLAGDMGIGKMALDAGKLLVDGILPTSVNVVHAMAAAADQGIAGSMVSSDHGKYKDYPGDEAGIHEDFGEKFKSGFPVQFQVSESTTD
jgi:hypothetical protein